MGDQIQNIGLQKGHELMGIGHLLGRAGRDFEADLNDRDIGGAVHLDARMARAAQGDAPAVAQVVLSLIHIWMCIRDRSQVGQGP